MISEKQWEWKHIAVGQRLTRQGGTHDEYRIFIPEIDLEGRENKRVANCQMIEIKSFKCCFCGVNSCFAITLEAEIHLGNSCHHKRKINTICTARCLYESSLQLMRKKLTVAPDRKPGS